MNNYKEKLVEVDEVLHHLSVQNFSKIPKDLINLIEENKDKNYRWYYNENLPLHKQNLSRDAIIILSWINMEYLLNSEQKEFLKQVHHKNEQISRQSKIKKYDSNLFKNSYLTKNNFNENSTELMPVEKKNFIQTLLNKIKNLFRKNP